MLAEYEVHSVTQSARFFPDDTTLVYGGKPLIEQLLVTGPKSASPLTSTVSWENAMHGTIAIAIDEKGPETRGQRASEPRRRHVCPPVEQRSAAYLGLTIGESIELKLVSDAKDPDGAKLIEASERVALGFLTNTLQMA